MLRRNFSLVNRIPHARIVRSAARDGHEQVIIQRVRIGRPFLSRSRLVGAVAVGAAIYGISRYISISVEVEEVNDGGWTTVGREADDEDEDDDEEYDPILFIPTGFSRLKPKRFWKGSDPEWQQFKKLATDRPRIDKIRGELVYRVRNAFAKHPILVAKAGKIDTSKGKVWIEVKFPDTTPNEYEQPGIELLEDGTLRKATRPVDSTVHHRLNRLFYPKEAAKAMYNSTTSKLGSSWKGFKVYMGWSPESKTETVQELVQRISANPRSSANPTTSVTSRPFSTSATPTQQPGASPSVAPVDGATKDLDRVTIDPKKFTLDLSQFQADFRRTFKPYPHPVPRGAFVVMGLVEVYGERAKITVSVHAVYDPKQGRYVGVSAVPYNFVEFRQSPKGGP